ncbi:MAG: Nif3-like dinuclear metal center hexameric protein, partial [Mucilaginibacter sp.]|uniref:Nif3-like dinuclear metal center hexameric protein n=1 Tax=Mucilaginibacter sp. TaxID=1882438 RepID=UPI0031B157CE
KEIPGGAIAGTVDTLKAGNRDIKVTGVVTSMFATVDVIKKAIAMNANFIIAHEPTFYNHADETAWLENDEVYQYKAKLLKDNNIAVWRNHDYVHSLAVDGVAKTLAQQLGWLQNGFAKNGFYKLNATLTLRQLIAHAKQKLGIDMLRYNGDLAQPCKKVLLLPGAWGGKNQIQAISRLKPDVVLCGEISEWETAEYIGDARAAGNKIALVLLGHIASEEPGSAFMLKWLQEKVPAVKATHIPSGNSLEFI